MTGCGEQPRQIRGLLPPLNDKLRSAFSEYMLREDSINMAATVAMGDIEPGATLPGLFLAWRRNDFFNACFAAIGTLGIGHIEFS